MFGHCGFDAWVVAEPFEELEGAIWFGEVGEWEETVKGVVAARVGEGVDAAAACWSGFICSARCGERGGAGFLALAGAGGLFVEVGDGFGWGAEESNLEFERVEWEERVELSGREWSLLHTRLGGYEELLVLSWNVEGALYLCGEVL